MAEAADVHWMSIPAFKIATEMGYDEDLVKKLLETEEFVNAGQLIERCFDITYASTCAFANLAKTPIHRRLERLSLKQLVPNVSPQVPVLPPSSKVVLNDVEKLRQETLKLMIQQNCKKCYMKPAQILCFPCCHLVYCPSCFNARIKTCFVCDIYIQDVITVYPA